MSKKKKKRGGSSATLLGVLVALLLIAGVAYFLVWKPIKQKAVDTVAEKTISSVAEKSGVESSVATEVYNNMSEEDKEVVQDIIEEHADPKTMQKAMDLYQEGDTAGLKEMAESEFSDEEIEQMKELYQKYVNN